MVRDDSFLGPSCSGLTQLLRKWSGEAAMISFLEFKVRLSHPVIKLTRRIIWLRKTSTDLWFIAKTALKTIPWPKARARPWKNNCSNNQTCRQSRESVEIATVVSSRIIDPWNIKPEEEVTKRNESLFLL